MEGWRRTLEGVLEELALVHLGHRLGKKVERVAQQLLLAPQQRAEVGAVEQAAEKAALRRDGLCVALVRTLHGSLLWPPPALYAREQRGYRCVAARVRRRGGGECVERVEAAAEAVWPRL